VPNSAPNSVHSYSDKLCHQNEYQQLVCTYMYCAASDVYGQLHSVSASCFHSDAWLWEMNEGERVSMTACMHGHN